MPFHSTRAVTVELLERRQLFSASVGNLRIATYNIEADIDGYTTPRPGLYTAIEGIGAEPVNGVTRPVDVLALQETTSNTATVQPIVDALNAYYGAGTYAMSSFQAALSVSGGSGPSALVYNTKTVSVVSTAAVAWSPGTYRQVVRYQFQPVGGAAGSDFYLYNSHAKAFPGAANQQLRNYEAQSIRADESSLPANARVLYVGDYNTDASTDPNMVTMMASGQGQAFDPLNVVGDWSSIPANLTEASTAIQYRDDIQLVTSNVLNDASGLRLIPGSYHTFGNNGSIAKLSSVASTSNTALAGVPNRSAILNALTTASDHLPMVADYNFPKAGASIAGTVKTTTNTAIANVTVYLDTNNNLKLDAGESNTLTTATGAYSFTGLAAGKYIVRQILPTGYTQKTPSGGLGIHVTVSATQSITNQNFVDVGNALASISGKVFNDANGNQKLDSTESGLSAWSVYIDTNNNGTRDASETLVTTATDGSFKFTGLSAGTYIIRAIRPAGWAQTTPTNNYGVHLTVAAGQQATGVQFGERRTA